MSHTISQSELREITKTLRNRGTREITTARTLDDIGLSDGAFTRESAIAMARVIIADLSSRKAIGKAEALLRVLLTIPEAGILDLRQALTYERKILRLERTQHGRAAERVGLANRRRNGKAEARRYNTVGAQARYTAEEWKAYADRPRYSEEEARQRTQAAIDRETERERAERAIGLTRNGFDPRFLRR
jgi:hypothetical protein